MIESKDFFLVGCPRPLPIAVEAAAPHRVILLKLVASYSALPFMLTAVLSHSMTSSRFHQHRPQDVQDLLMQYQKFSQLVKKMGGMKNLFSDKPNAKVNPRQMQEVNMQMVSLYSGVYIYIICMIFFL